MHPVFLAQDVVHGHLAFAGGGMGQHREAGHVARRIDARDVRAHLLIDLDAIGTAGGIQGEFHPDVFQADALETGPAAHGDKDLVPLRPAGVSVRILIDDFVPFHGDDLAAEMELHALLRVLGLEHRADLVVQRAQDLREHLHHRHLRADGIEEARELHPDDAAADDHERFGLGFQRQDLPVGDDHVSEAFAKAGDGRNRRLGARTDQQVASLIGRFPAGDDEAFGAAALDDGLFLDNLHLGVPHLDPHAADEFLHHLLLALEDGAEIDGGALDVHAVFVGVPAVIIDFGAVQQRLGRDAALIQAYPAQFPFLEEDDRQAGGTGALRGHIAAGASPDDREIVHSVFV